MFIMFYMSQLLSEVLILGPPRMRELSGVLTMLTGRFPTSNNDPIQSVLRRGFAVLNIQFFLGSLAVNAAVVCL